jgi:predicted esterase
VVARQAHLLALAQAAAARGPLVLAGSSLGAYIAGRVSLEVPVVGLFLMAPPITMGPLQELDASPVPVSIIHGWDDELIPGAARRRLGTLRAARDCCWSMIRHRLSEHVEASAEAFAALLKEVQP